MRWKIYIFLLFTLFASDSVCSNIPELISTYYLETFQGKCKELEKSQVWDIASGSENYMFFASNEGLGVYDGVRWEIYNVEEELVFRSLYYDANTNLLYAGSINQFGKWEQTGNGKFHYTPLWINDKENQFIEFWRIRSPLNSEYIYAQSHQLVLRYHIPTGQIEKVIKAENFKYMHLVAGDIWIQENNGLYKMENNDLKKIIDVEDRIIHISVRDPDKRMVLFLEHEGLFILSSDFTTLTSLNEDTNATLSKAKMFAAEDGKNGKYLIGTTKKGMYVLDTNGAIIRHTGEQDGLPTPTVLSLDTDNDNNIWMGLDAGVARLHTGSKETFYSPTPSIGNVTSLAYSDNQLYIGTNQGLFKISEKGELSSIENAEGPIWSILSIDGIIHYNHDLGVFRLENDKPVLIKEGGSTSLVRSILHPEYLVGGDYYGLSLYKTVANKIEYLGKIKNYVGSSNSIHFDKHGYLWAIIPKTGFIRLRFSDDMRSVEETKKYTMQSIDNNRYLQLIRIDDQLIFYDGTACYKYDNESEKLLPDHTTNDIFQACGDRILSITQFDHIFWYQKADDIGYVVRDKNKFEKTSGVFSPIYNRRISSFITQDDADNYMIGYQNGIAFSQLTKQENKKLEIRMAEGYGSGTPVFYHFDSEYFELPYNKRLINIYPVHLNPNREIEYRIAEKDSAWIKEKIDNCLTLTYLESGKYTIQIRNAGDIANLPAEISFSIAPPWYASSFMVFLYCCMTFLILTLIYFYFRHKLEKDKRRIEQKRQAQIEKLEKENLIQSQQILALEKDKLEIEVKDKDKRLAFITMNGVKRNNMMNELKKDILETEKQNLTNETRQTIKKIVKKIDTELKSTNDWEIFENYFNIVFDGLLEKLATKYPCLTQGDLKLLAYLKLNLSNKEIANLLSISYRSVEMSKYRLRKKLELDRNDNFHSILNSDNLES